nr:hypothetical protein Itr_chr03CG06150 [Ipomoea trifida]GLL30746.1 hypothetical protein Itr_chr07CG01790 [Ipomoea trifida]
MTCHCFLLLSYLVGFRTSRWMDDEEEKRSSLGVVRKFNYVPPFYQGMKCKDSACSVSLRIFEENGQELLAINKIITSSYSEF